MEGPEEAFEEGRETHESPGTGNKIKEIMIGWLVSQAGLIGCRRVRCSHRGLSAVWGGAGHVAERPDRPPVGSLSFHPGRTTVKPDNLGRDRPPFPISEALESPRNPSFVRKKEKSCSLKGKPLKNPEARETDSPIEGAELLNR